MTDLLRLNVSLTKHGAHKVATLLKQYEADEVLNHLAGSVEGVNIESAQAKKTLCVTKRNKVPELWKEAKLRGAETIDALVMIAIIFSHHQLIHTMANSREKQKFSGTIYRGVNIDGKAYTNLAHIIEELGYSTEHSSEHVTYNLHKLFQINRLNELVAKLLTLKLEAAGWEKTNNFIDEALALGFHDVFSISPAEFKTWMSAGELTQATAEDSDFFFGADDAPSVRKFVFRPGHNIRKTGTIKVTPAKSETTATLLHNEIQNSLYANLVRDFGKDNVGTENDTGQGTSIDIVVKTKEILWFYEIKTAPTVRGCIRQAIPQLLEYAYWHGNDNTADRLIIVSRLPVTKKAETYLSFLRKKFGLPIYYQQHLAKHD